MTDPEKVAEDFVHSLTVTWPTPYAKGEKAEREAIRVLTAALRDARNEGLEEAIALVPVHDMRPWDLIAAIRSKKDSGNG